LGLTLWCQLFAGLGVAAKTIQVRLTFNLVATFYLDDLKVITLSTEIYSIPNPAKSPWRGGKNSIS
jgi:hypothetical protein